MYTHFQYYLRKSRYSLSLVGILQFTSRHTKHTEYSYDLLVLVHDRFRHDHVPKDGTHEPKEFQSRTFKLLLAKDSARRVVFPLRLPFSPHQNHTVSCAFRTRVFLPQVFAVRQ